MNRKAAEAMKIPRGAQTAEACRLCSELAATGWTSRRLKLALAYSLWGQGRKDVLGKVVGLMGDAALSGPLTFPEKCRLQRAQVALRNRDEESWMGPSGTDPWGNAYPRGLIPGSKEAANWDAIGNPNEYGVASGKITSVGGLA